MLTDMTDPVTNPELLRQPGPGPAPHDRVLVFVVAHSAEENLVRLFEGFPKELLADPDIDFLCIDDASADSGAETLAAWVGEEGLQSIRVLRNPVNQGHGGNRKLGCTIAVEEGYDLIVLLDGNGRYDHGLVAAFTRERKNSGADVILGTGTGRGSLGNRLLTRAVNKLTGLALSECLPGCRAYAVSFLREIKFALNTNGPNFDTEILLQAAHMGADVTELPVLGPDCERGRRAGGPAYAWRMLGAVAGFRLHRLGIVCSLKYRRQEAERYVDKTNTPYSSHRMALDHVLRMRPERLLDVGCGSGHVAMRCQEQGIEVTGIDRDARPAYPLAAFFKADLDRDPFPVDLSDFGVVLLLDIIEHLSEPEIFLTRLRNRHLSHSDPERIPTVILSTPNVAFVGIRLSLLCGRFTYAERGILDITHRRLFTRRSLLRALRGSGYRVRRVQAVPPPFERVVGGRAGRFLGLVGRVLACLWPGAFAFQFLVICQPLPGLARILADAQRLTGKDAFPDPEGDGKKSGIV